MALHRGRRLKQTLAITSIYLVAYLLLVQAKMFKAASAVGSRLQSSRVGRVAGRLVPKRGLRSLGRRYYSSNSSSEQNQAQAASWRRLLKWVAVPVGAGAGYIGLKRWHSKKLEGLSEEDVMLQPGLMSTALTFLPTRSLSRLWGAVNEMPLPTWARRPVLGLYAKAFGCNLAEAEDPVLEHYTNLQSFFMRKLVANARPTADSLLVSPADCRVMNFGHVEGDVVKQVKGLTYSLKSFLGEGAQAKPGHSLFHIVLYLAPGDYHHFHSPAAWTASLRRHFPGALLSVSPFAMSRIKGLLALNERVVLKGEWEHGLFTYTAVGAYNVGSIVIDADPLLQTNVRTRVSTKPISIEGPLVQERVAFNKGDRVGSFRLGSTIVLVFEAPSDFKFTVEPGEKLRVGQSIGHLSGSDELQAPQQLSPSPVVAEQPVASTA